MELDRLPVPVHDPAAPAELLAPASPYDTLDPAGVSAMLHISDPRTLASLIDDYGLPVARIGRRGMRVFIRGDVLDWLRSLPAPERRAG